MLCRKLKGKSASEMASLGLAMDGTSAQEGQ
jgi:hypothetical protein